MNMAGCGPKKTKREGKILFHVQGPLGAVLGDPAMLQCSGVCPGSLTYKALFQPFELSLVQEKKKERDYFCFWATVGVAQDYILALSSEIISDGLLCS